MEFGSLEHGKYVAGLMFKDAKKSVNNADLSTKQKAMNYETIPIKIIIDMDIWSTFPDIVNKFN